MPTRRGTIALELGLIFILATAVGVVLNRTLLIKAWQGEPIGKPPVSAEGAIPMPLGLMQVKEMYDAKEAVLVDARDTASYAEGHLAGAVNLPLGEAQKRPDRPLAGRGVRPDVALITYCNGFSCHDSLELGKILLQAGYRTVYVYEGGFPEWQGAGYPIATGGP